MPKHVGEDARFGRAVRYALDLRPRHEFKQSAESLPESRTAFQTHAVEVVSPLLRAVPQSRCVRYCAASIDQGRQFIPNGMVNPIFRICDRSVNVHRVNAIHQERRDACRRRKLFVKEHGNAKGELAAFNRHKLSVMNLHLGGSREDRIGLNVVVPNLHDEVLVRFHRQVGADRAADAVEHVA